MSEGASASVWTTTGTGPSIRELRAAERREGQAVVSSKDTRDWLEGKPHEVAIVIAARAALRVVPFLALAVGSRGGGAQKAGRDIILPVLRATAAPWVAGQYPSHRADIAERAAAAAYAAYIGGDGDAGTAEAHAATLVGDARAVDGAVSAAAYAASLVGDARTYITARHARAVDTLGATYIAARTHAASATTAAADSADASAIDRGEAVTAVAGLPLWPGGEPSWARKHWTRLKRELLALNEGWEVWTNWYESRRKGRSANEALEVARVMIAEEIWKQGPKVVNAEIRRLVEKRPFTALPAASSQPAQTVTEGVRDLDSEDAVYILEDLPKEEQADLGRLSAPERAELVRVLDFPEGSAGRLMQIEFIAVPPAWSVGQTIDYMREKTEDLPARFFEIYVIDSDSRFRGAVPLDRLMRTKRQVGISDLMESERHLVHAGEDQEVVARRFERYNLVVAPVIDAADRMVGVITFDDIVDVIEEEAEEDKEDIKALRAREGEEELPGIPQRRNAAVKPLWEGQVLKLPNVPIPTDQGEVGFASALLGMRDVLRNFADEISNEANIDRRFVAFIRRLAGQIPETAPLQHELFEIGHVEAAFSQYTQTVNEQWPNFLAARYHSVVLQFDRTMRQSEAWREFKRNAQEAKFTDAQTRDAAQLANATAAVLRNDEAGDFVDPLVPQVLERLADPRSRWQDDALAEIEAGNEELAADLVESTNNVLKAIAEVALPVVTEVAAAARRTTSKTAAAFWDEFEKGAVAEAKARGRPAGRAAVRWLLRFAAVTGGAAGAGGAAIGAYAAFTRLAAQYPEAFGWLEQLLQFFRHTLPL